MSIPLRISTFYFLFAVLWILTSDTIAHLLFGSNAQVLLLVQSSKGLLFVFATTLLLYFLIRWETDSRLILTEKLTITQEQFQYLFTHNPQAMWIYDRETLAFLEVNEMAVTKYGYSRTEFLKMRLTDIRPPEDIPVSLENAEQQRDPLQLVGDLRYQLKNGQIIYVNLTTYLIDFEGHNAAMVVVQDVTEKKHYEAERLEKQSLQVALDREIQLHRLRTRFVSMASHELRTPLAAMTLSIDMIQRYQDKMSEQDQQRHLEKIQQNIKRLTHLSDDMLSVLRTDAVTPHFNPQNFDLTIMLMRTIEDISFSDKNHHHIHCSLPPEPVMYHGDEKLLRQALQNVLTNAMKYSPEGGDIAIQVVPNESEIKISVKDSGIGIPEEDQQKIFQGFYRAQNVGSIPGNGLGMVIVKQAVELHGGQVSIQSQRGAGTTINLLLPVQHPERINTY